MQHLKQTRKQIHSYFTPGHSLPAFHISRHNSLLRSVVMYSKDKGLDFSRVMFICSVSVRSITLLLKLLIMQSGCANKAHFWRGWRRKCIKITVRKGQAFLTSSQPQGAPTTHMLANTERQALEKEDLTAWGGFPVQRHNSLINHHITMHC